MKTQNWLKNKMQAFQDDFDFRLESLILDITEKFSIRLDEKNISRTKFAQRLGISSPAVTKLLNGNNNFTLKTILSVADVLGLKLSIDLEEKTEKTYTFSNVISIPLASEGVFKPHHKKSPTKTYSSTIVEKRDVAA